jgi:hypothetical protein
MNRTRKPASSTKKKLKKVKQNLLPHLDVFERMTHHSNEHVNEYDDDGHVIQREQEHADCFDYVRRFPLVYRWVDIQVLIVGFVGITDLQAVEAHLPEHAPE